MLTRDRATAILVLAMGVWLSLAAAPWATAQQKQPPAKETSEQTVRQDRTGPARDVIVRMMPMREIFRVGGPLMYVLLALSFVALALVLYYSFVLRKEQVIPRDLRRDLAAKLSSGTVGEIRSACYNSPSPLASVTLAALDYLQSVSAVDPAMLKDVIQSEGARQAEGVQGKTRYLMDVGSIAPLVGLLGTVTGMVTAFRAVAVDETMARPIVLANGVWQALYTTVGGLLIAIPAMIFYTYFRERAVSLISSLEAASMEMLNGLLRRRS